MKERREYYAVLLSKSKINIMSNLAFFFSKSGLDFLTV